MAEILRLPAPEVGQASPGEAVLATRGLSVWAGGRPILRRVDLEIYPHRVLGILGPSGVGKSTFLKCLNRLVDLEPELRVEGEVTFHGRSVDRSDADELRARIGILFQQPVVFPRSIYQNVLFGLRHHRRLPRRVGRETAEEVLRRVSLWDEVKERLDEPAGSLSVGQQQRLCLARTLALEPEVILMDEPTSALDPKSTEAIEELILALKERHTVVLVTHNLGQARRLADELACLCLRDGAGELVERACCAELFENPQCREVLDYLHREAP